MIWVRLDDGRAILATRGGAIGPAHTPMEVLIEAMKEAVLRERYDAAMTEPEEEVFR